MVIREQHELDALANEIVSQHATVLRTALGAYIERMREARDEAQGAFDAIKDDPAKRAAQDQTLFTTQGLRHAADMFQQSAEAARTVRDLIDEYEFGPADPANHEDPARHDGAGQDRSARQGSGS
jgi:hypothetical protein